MMDVSALGVEQVAVVAGIGLVAGTLGGALGVGGSVIMIPGLTLVFGPDQHLYQASAMIANIAVSVPAAWRHHRAGATMPDLLRRFIPAALLCVLMGVWLSNLALFEGRDGGRWLGRVLALFLLYVIYANIRKLLTKPKPPTVPTAQAPQAPDAGTPADQRDTDTASPTAPASDTAVGSAWVWSVGGVLGLTAGLLGIGGGAIAVPLQQQLLRVPLKNAIANSSTVICVSAAVGAIYKTASLGQHGYAWTTALIVAAALAPTAVVGGYLGASLTHLVPERSVRAAFVLLMIVAAWRMAALV